MGFFSHLLYVLLFWKLFAIPTSHPLHFWIEALLKKKLNLLMSALFPQFQINMQRKMRFTGIVTQGASRMGTAEFIKAFKVASSLDGKTYTMYRTDGERKDRVRRYNTTLKKTLHYSPYVCLSLWPYWKMCQSRYINLNTHNTSLCF